jgi:hypothetical protein
MNPAREVQTLVDRGLELLGLVVPMLEELKRVDARLEELALAGEQVDLEDSERDGRQFLARGSERIVPVVITADALIKQFQAHTPKHDEVRAVAGERLPQFYREVTKYERVIDSGKKFRKAALEVLGKDDGARLITACIARDKHGIPKNAIKIEWDRAKEVAE